MADRDVALTLISDVEAAVAKAKAGLSSEPTPVPPLPPPAPRLRDRVGIALGGWGTRWSTSNLDLCAELGVTYVRADAPLSAAERSACEARGLRVVLIPTQYGRTRQGFVDWCKSNAATHGNKVVYELGNEPNLKWQVSWWREPGEYRIMAEQARDAIRAVVPAATILMAGLTMYGRVGESGSGGTNPVTYLQQMGGVPAGLRPNIHPYNSGRSVIASKGDPWDAYTQADQMSPECWGTEMGYATLNHPHKVSESAQASLLVEAVRVWLEKPSRGPIFPFTLRDYAATDEGYGLIRPDGSRKPAFAALKSLLAT